MIPRGKLLPFRLAADTGEALSDEALLAASVIGDSTALGALFDRRHLSVYRFLARLSGTDRRDLDDLVQATFVEVARSAARFRGGSNVLTWIFGIAANVARHHTRGEVRRRSALAALGWQPVPAAVRPDELTEQRDIMNRAQRVVAALPHDLRVVFVLCEIEEVSGVDAARALGVRPGTVWRRLHEARVAIRNAFLTGESP